ncbi:MAG TPA: T3SS effector HopA1 family protein [Acidisarcina sp.]
MTSSYRADLQPIVSALQFLSNDNFTFAGHPATPGGQYAAISPPGSPPVISKLQNHLYAHCFTRRFPPTTLPEIPVPPAADFLSSLSAANCGVERWDRGWQVDQSLSTGALLLHRHGQYRTVWPGEFVYQDGFGRAPQPTALVSIFVARESLTVQPGYYFAFGSTAGDLLDEKHLFRLYWNVMAGDAAALMRALTFNFNRFGIPFKFKLPTDPFSYVRVDTGVSYIPRRYFSIAVDLALDVRASLGAALQPDVPLFTRPLAPGLAFAEDPGNSESFGTARCRLLAQGLWEAYTKGAAGLEASLAAVEAAFHREGISLDHPYLNPGSPAYEFPDPSMQAL